MRVIEIGSVGVVLALSLATPTLVLAATTAICDANGTSAVADGVIGASEYAGFSTGINNGFTGMIGAGVRLYADSDASGNVAFAIDATTHQCTWGANDSVVIYIDSTSGGFANTAMFTDISDGGRAAASGRGTASGTSVLTFGTSFFADYAIVLRNDSASLFQLSAGGAHTFVRSLTRGPIDWTTNPCVREAAGITLADLSSTGSFHYVATLINASNAFRSDELQGSAPLVFVQGANPMTLPADGFNVFSRVSAIQTLTPMAPFEEHFCTYAGTGFVPAPTVAQLDSDLWRVTGFSDGAMAFGGSYTVGDYARLVGTDATTTGGAYAFRQTPAERGFGVQPGGTDVDPGDVDLRLLNTGTTGVVSVTLRYNVYYLNNQTRSGVISFRYSTDDTTYTSVGALDVTTPLAIDALGWTLASRSTTLTVGVPVGAPLYLRWHHVSSGANSRDKFAIDDVLVTPTFAVCGNGIAESGEACDAGASNGTATSCCTATCGARPEFTSCGVVGSGACDLADSCDAMGTCVDRVLPPLASCRASRGTCDLEEACDGTSQNCPADMRVAAGTLCRVASGAICDVSDFCDGVSDPCPQTFAMAGTACGPASPPCDLGAACTGASATCPAHTPASASTLCRAMAGGCDVADFCSGSSLACGVDVVTGAGTVCRVASDLCDVAEACNGISSACPSDVLAGAGVVCRPANGACDVADSCDGTGAACPADGVAANGTSCDDGLACNGTSTCQSGSCTPGSPPSCADTNVCTTDACNDPSGACSHTPIGGCCNGPMDCNDANLCTTDTCGASATCGHTLIPAPGCCSIAADCDDADVCTANTCPAAGGACVFASISGCCHSAADCNDGLTCTTDSCAAATHTCQHAAIAGCCSTVADCNDSNVCTTDSCASDGSCGNVMIVGCCRADGDCADANTCTSDTCDLTAHTCTHGAIANCCHAGDSCDDSDFCTDDSCNAGTERCAHAAHSCDDSNVCTSDSCSAGACHNVLSCIDGGMDAATSPDGGVDAGADDAAVGLDAGIGLDAASVADTGAAVDAGDAGHEGGIRDGAIGPDAADAGAPVVSRGACGCRVGASPRPSGAVFVLGFALALLVARRRRRSLA